MAQVCFKELLRNPEKKYKLLGRQMLFQEEAQVIACVIACVLACVISGGGSGDCMYDCMRACMLFQEEAQVIACVIACVLACVMVALQLNVRPLARPPRRPPAFLRVGGEDATVL